MHALQNKPGVYALVMRLPKNRRLSIGRLCTSHVFLAGWYIYVGSALGPGGVKSRIARHLRRSRSGKRKHWHVDYLREVASIEEVWFCYTKSPRREHEWVRGVQRMHGATVPVAGFGSSDCDQGCEAHLAYFPARPFTEGFRAVLGSRQQPEKILVHFPKRQQSAPRDSVSPVLGAYLRGRQFQEARRFAIHDTGEDEDTWKSLARGQPARELIELIAAKLDIPVPQLKSDAQLALAIDELCRNCGEDAIRAAFQSDRPQTVEAILKLSRKSREVQQHRIAVVLDPTNLGWSLSPQGKEQISDTKNFAKTLSRLARARGLLEAIESAIRMRSLQFNLRIEARKIASRMMPVLAEQTRIVNRITTTPDEGSFQQERGTPRSAATTMDLKLVRAPLGLVEKNVRDLPRSSYDLRPTPTQLATYRSEVARIRKCCKQIPEALSAWSLSD